MIHEVKPPSEIELQSLIDDFSNLRNAHKGKERIVAKLKSYEDNPAYLELWRTRSVDAESLYPSQGLLQTPYDYLDCTSTIRLEDSTIIDTLRVQTFFLELFNHPLRIHHLLETNKQPFSAPPEVESNIFIEAKKNNTALSIGDIAGSVHWENRDRISRSDRYAQGPFVKLGKQARSVFVGSESPDVWNSAVAIATMAASHCLAAIPRNGILQDITRQADFAEEVFQWLNYYEELILADRPDRETVAALWHNNVMGTLEGSPDKALKRAEALAKKGIRSFRPYSPEPGTGPISTTESLRKEYGNDFEIITGQIVSLEQEHMAEAAGADGGIIGIGGGGRCITGPRSGLPIDWPELVWEMRGKAKIPIIVQGGASDHVAVTLQLGASGIGVSRIVAGGTIESPGGALYCVDTNGQLYKPYGGEASARNKYIEGKMLPFEIPSFVEGETTKAHANYFEHTLPTLTYNLHTLNENAILALVFKSAGSIEELQAISPSPLKQITNSGEYQRNTH